MPDRLYSPGQIEEIRNAMKTRLAPKRFAHSVEVAEIAVYYAESAGIDTSKAEMAALLHDVARELSGEEMQAAVERYSVPLTRYNKAFPPSIHGKVGAAIAEREYGIADEEVLAAIRNHVSGRPCMKPLEQIVFLADHISRLYIDKDNETADRVREMPLNEATYQMLGIVIRYDAKHKKKIDERTRQTFDWLLEKIRNEAKTGRVDLSEAEMTAFYERMDGFLDLYAAHAVLGFPAENMRDLGGYPAADGRVIRKNKILRSGNLDAFTAADFERLSSRGISHIIDLRTENEKKARYDGNLSGIRYVSVPFDATCECKPYLQVLLEWINDCDDTEESAWLVSRYFDAFDIDEMYLRLLFDTESREKFIRILDILRSDDCEGVLFFCHSGKDRTGIVASLIMNALGVGPKTAMNDYMVSQIPYYAITMKYLHQLRRKEYNVAVQRQVIDVLGVEAGRPKRLNQEILSRFGDYQNYFDFETVFGKAEKEKFRAKYLEADD